MIELGIAGGEYPKGTSAACDLGSNPGGGACADERASVGCAAATGSGNDFLGGGDKGGGLNTGDG